MQQVTDILLCDHYGLLLTLVMSLDLSSGSQQMDWKKEKKVSPWRFSRDSPLYKDEITQNSGSL